MQKFMDAIPQILPYKTPIKQILPKGASIYGLQPKIYSVLDTTKIG